MKLIFPLLLLLTLVEPVAAQTVGGVVLDSATQAPVPYVHIGVPGKNVGIISRNDGSFQIDLSKVALTDSLTFSSIGYQTQRIVCPNRPQNALKVYLTPQAYTLREVLVEDERVYDPVKLGRYKPTKITTGHSGSDDFGFGGEWGVLISNHGQTYRIADISFHTRFNTMDSALFRINIYSVQDSLPHESLLRRRLLVKSYRRDKWITKDVFEERLLIDQDIVVTFEVLQLWRSSRGNNALFFTHDANPKQSRLYRRPSSLAPWEIQEEPPLTLYLHALGYVPEGK